MRRCRSDLRLYTCVEIGVKVGYHFAGYGLTARENVMWIKLLHEGTERRAVHQTEQEGFFAKEFH